MVFSSFVFLWGFLPIVFVINYFIKPQYSNAWLLMASLFFYAWGEPYLVLLMIVSIIINWIIGMGIEKYSSYGKQVLAIGVILNLLALGYYKYANFGVRIINSLFGKEIFPVPAIALPIGISFFTFQAISYIVDVYRGETRAQSKLINVALYISFFPQLIAGPIVKYKDINKQIENRAISMDKIARGFRRFIYGLSKKVLISNVLGKTADIIFNFDVGTISGITAWSAALCYTFQIYYDFSGYSDMAIGLGQMFGFDIPENFNYPYLSKTVGEFWRRWHISLGSWFKEYVYIPLGGNRKGKVRTYINLTIVFFLTGLWHGANWKFIVWGFYYGLFAIIERNGLQKFLNKSKVISRIYMFLIINFGWVLFRVNHLMDIVPLAKRLVTPWLYTESDIATWQYCDRMTIFVFICAILGMGVIQKIVPEKIKGVWKFSIMEFAYCSIMLILCITSLAGGTYNPFIYFQF